MVNISTTSKDRISQFSSCKSPQKVLRCLLAFSNPLFPYTLKGRYSSKKWLRYDDLGCRRRICGELPQNHGGRSAGTQKFRPPCTGHRFAAGAVYAGSSSGRYGGFRWHWSKPGPLIRYQNFINPWMPENPEGRMNRKDCICGFWWSPIISPEWPAIMLKSCTVSYLNKRKNNACKTYVPMIDF